MGLETMEIGDDRTPIGSFRFTSLYSTLPASNKHRVPGPDGPARLVRRKTTADGTRVALFRTATGFYERRTAPDLSTSWYRVDK